MNTLKRYLYDHGDGSSVGGIANFSAKVTDYDMRTIPGASEGSGGRIIIKWGLSGDHAMTFVGYNDSIKYDFNGDGKYTNDIDINGDNIVNLLDWEKGALKIANSWGTSFGVNGFVYMMYRLLFLPESSGGIGNGDKYVYCESKGQYA